MMRQKRKSYHTIRDFLFIMFKHRTFTAFFCAVFIISGITYCLVVRPVYEAESKLLVKNFHSAAIETGRSGKTDSNIDTAVEILQSRYLIEKTIKKLGLASIYPDINRKHVFSRLSVHQKAVLEFKSSLKIQKGQLVTVRFRHADPVVAAKIVNSLMEEFLEYYFIVQKQDQRYDFLKNQVAQVKHRLEQAQNELGLFRHNNSISSITKQKSLLLLQISELEIECAKTSAEISEQEWLAKTASKNSSNLKKIQNKMVAVKNRGKKLSQQITQYKLELNRFDKTETRLRELERQVKIEEENYFMYVKKLEEARIENAMDAQQLVNFTVIEPAMAPITPVWPLRGLIIALAVLIGCLGGLAGSFVLEYFSHTFDSCEELGETLGCSGVASFHEFNGRENRLISQFSLPDKVMKECNCIKNYALKTIPHENKTILFASPGRGEGASTVLFAFANCLASEGEKVLVVDTNLRAPVLHKWFKADSANGLSEVLSGEIEVSQAVRTTPVENLKLLASGRNPLKALFMLRSEKFTDLLDSLKAEAQWILFDCPPVNSCSDSCMISSSTDTVVLVVKAGKTRWEAASSALHQLQQWGQNTAGAVLNRKKMAIPDWLYKRL